MPLYAYRCNECGYEFEQRQRMSDDPLTECPVCEGEIRRVINSVGILFKGSGFYITDNKATSKATSTSTNGTSDSGDGGGTKETSSSSENGSAKSEKSESKPAAKQTENTNTSK